MGRNSWMKDCYVHNFVSLQEYHPADILLFCSYNKSSRRFGTLQICGHLPKSEFLKKAEYFEKGEKRYRCNGTFFVLKAPLYEIENSKLISINSMEDLKKVGK